MAENVNIPNNDNDDDDDDTLLLEDDKFATNNDPRFYHILKTLFVLTDCVRNSGADERRHPTGQAGHFGSSWFLFRALRVYLFPSLVYSVSEVKQIESRNSFHQS